jgi:hypothetical protein
MYLIPSLRMYSFGPYKIAAEYLQKFSLLRPSES